MMNKLFFGLFAVVFVYQSKVCCSFAWEKKGNPQQSDKNMLVQCRGAYLQKNTAGDYQVCRFLPDGRVVVLSGVNPGENTAEQVAVNFYTVKEEKIWIKNPEQGCFARAEVAGDTLRIYPLAENGARLSGIFVYNPLLKEMNQELR